MSDDDQIVRDVGHALKLIFGDKTIPRRQRERAIASGKMPPPLWHAFRYSLAFPWIVVFRRNIGWSIVRQAPFVMSLLLSGLIILQMELGMTGVRLAAARHPNPQGFGFMFYVDALLVCGLFVLYVAMLSIRYREAQRERDVVLSDPGSAEGYDADFIGVAHDKWLENPKYKANPLLIAQHGEACILAVGGIIFTLATSAIGPYLIISALAYAWFFGHHIRLHEEDVLEIASQRTRSQLLQEQMPKSAVECRPESAGFIDNAA